MPKSLSARIFLALIVISGFLLLGDAIANTHSLPSVRFLVLLALATVTARLKVKLPGLTGVMSVNLPFILLAMAATGAAEALMVVFISTFAQCLPRQKHKFNAVQIAFNCCALMLALGAARWIYTAPEVISAVSTPALRLAIAAVGYFLVDTVAVSMVIALTEAASLLRTWAEMVQLSFPYLVAGTSVAGLALTVGQDIRWQVPLALLPVMIGIFVSYRRFFTAATAQIIAEASMEATSAAAAAHT
jgi:hypothetical protein